MISAAMASNSRISNDLRYHFPLVNNYAIIVYSILFFILIIQQHRIPLCIASTVNREGFHRSPLHST